MAYASSKYNVDILHHVVPEHNGKLSVISETTSSYKFANVLPILNLTQPQRELAFLRPGVT